MVGAKVFRNQKENRMISRNRVGEYPGLRNV